MSFTLMKDQLFMVGPKKLMLKILNKLKMPARTFTISAIQ